MRYDQIEIDDHNEAHVTAHGVSLAEIENVLSRSPVVRRNRKGRSAEFTATGTTLAGRRVKIAFNLDDGNLRPITAWEDR